MPFPPSSLSPNYLSSSLCNIDDTGEDAEVQVRMLRYAVLPAASPVSSSMSQLITDLPLIANSGLGESFDQKDFGVVNVSL